MTDRVSSRLLTLLKKESGIGKPEIARKLGCSLSTVYRRMRALEDAGTLTFGGGKVEVAGKRNFVTWGSTRKIVTVVPEAALRLLPHIADDPRVNKESLAKKMKCSLVTVYERLHLLEKAGYVKVGRKIVTLAGPAKRVLCPEPRLKIVISNVNPLSIYRDMDSYLFSPEKEVDTEWIDSPESSWVVIGGHSKGMAGFAARENKAGGRMSEGVKVTGKRGTSDTFQVVSKYVKVRMGCAVGVLSRAEVGRLCGQAKGLLERGFTREEIEAAVDNLDRDPWFKDKKWGFKAIEKDVLHTRMVREKQVPRLQPLADPMDKFLAEEASA